MKPQDVITGDLTNPSDRARLQAMALLPPQFRVWENRLLTDWQFIYNPATGSLWVGEQAYENCKGVLRELRGKEPIEDKLADMN